MRERGQRLHNNKELAAEGVKITGITAPQDQSGFDVFIEPTDKENARETAARLSEQVTGVPIRSVTEQQLDVPATRQDDESPWWGGAMMVATFERNRCTTGFSVHYDDTDTSRMLSANHCNNPTGTSRGFYDGTVSDVFSSTGDSMRIPMLDSLLLNPVGGTTGTIYIGNKEIGTGRGVKTKVNNIEDTGVRISGANSGEQVALNIDVAGTYDRPCPGNTAVWCIEGYIAERVGGGIAVAQGDSGGPMWLFLLEVGAGQSAADQQHA